VLACRIWSCSPRVRAAAWKPFAVVSARAGSAGLTSAAMIVAVGTNSCNSSSRFGPSSTSKTQLQSPSLLWPKHGRVTLSDAAMTRTPTRHRRHQAKGPAITKARGPGWPKENQYSLRTNTLRPGITGALTQLKGHPSQQPHGRAPVCLVSLRIDPNATRMSFAFGEKLTASGISLVD
jgi:hypothetical protein